MTLVAVHCYQKRLNDLDYDYEIIYHMIEKVDRDLKNAQVSGRATKRLENKQRKLYKARNKILKEYKKYQQKLKKLK